MFPHAKPRGTLKVEGNQNSLFPEGSVIKCFVIPANSKNRTDDLLDLTLTVAVRAVQAATKRAVLPKRYDNSLCLRGNKK